MCINMARSKGTPTIALILIVICCAVTYCSSSSPLSANKYTNPLLVENDDISSISYRLSPVSEPVSYDLFLDMTDESFSIYSGTIDIVMKYIGNGTSFSLNSAGLTINGASLRVSDANGALIPIKSFDISPEFEQLYFNFAENLKINAIYKVYIEFSGTINKNLFKGVYRSSYRVEDKIKYLATTFFAATYARTVFPCYDEPAHKARFNVRIRHLPHHTALSNMPAIQRIEHAQYSETTFDTTPLMSTYLVAFVVSELETLSADNELFRVFAPETQVNYTTYAHEVATRSLRMLENFFGRQNQMSKIDLVAIPDFAMGAMENWGMITFREDYLIYENEQETTAAAKQSIAAVVTHELVHMWFGNEVTPEWWTYVWLNEGFARYFEYYITSQLEPTWNLWEQFIVNNVHSALSQDCHSHNRPMNYYATNPDVLNNLFDYVVYAKSASVIRMVQNVIGFDTFKQALNDYLRSRSYLTTRPQYLYTSIEKFRTVDLPDTVEAIFESWANAPGYPVVTVSFDRTTRTLTASQKRFWLPNDNDSPPENKLFFVPLNYASNIASLDDFEDTAPTFWLTPSNPTATVTVGAGLEWVVVNKQQTGYYRVNYDATNWQKLIDALNSDQFDVLLPVINRAQLVDDVANLARAGEVSYDVALSLLQYLERETEYIPWSTAYNALLHLDRMFSGNKDYMRFESFLRTITERVFNETENSSPHNHMSRLHREKSIYLACYSGVQACLNMVTTALEIAISDGSLNIAKEMQTAVFCALNKFKIPLEANYGLELFQKFWVSPDKYGYLINKYINAVGCARDPAMIEFFLQLIELDVELFPITLSMKTNILINLIKGGSPTRIAAIQFINQRFPEVSSNLQQQLVPMFDAFGSSINTPAEYQMLLEIINTHSSLLDPPVLDAATQALNQAQQNLHWLDKYSDGISEWLADRNIGDTDDSGTGTITFSLISIIVALPTLVWHTKLTITY